MVEGGTQGLNLRQVAGTVEKEIIPLTKGQLYGVTFSPDSSSLYYSFKQVGERITSIYRVSVLGGDPQRIGTDSDLGLSISPDGKRLVFAREKGNQSSIVIMNVEGGGEETILTRAAPSNFDFPQWSPDGNTLVYVVYSVDPQGYFVNLEEVNLADRTPRVLNAGRWRQISGITWLPDGGGLILCARAPSSSFAIGSPTC